MDGTSTQDKVGETAGSSAAARAGYAVDIARIMAVVPHRYPFLMIDRVVDIVPGRTAEGIKNVTINESFFQGHFPHYPVMPGVLVIESFCQTSAVLIMETLGGPEKTGLKGVYLMSVEVAKFRRPVVPGDQLRIHVEASRNRGQVWKFNGVARVDGAAVAEATWTAMITDRSTQGSPWGEAK